MSALHTGATVAETYRAAVEQFPDRVALVLPDGSHWTYAGLRQRVQRMARALQALGLKHQDGLAVLTGNRPEALVVLIASAWLGLRQTSLHPLGALDDQAFVLQDAGIAALVVGYLYLVDRAKDMVITGGFNVYSSEVEACLALHPAVAQSAVIGIPDAKWGEAVAALVVLKPGASATPEELMDFVHARKGALHTPKQLSLESELPLTPLGKIDKKTLRARFWGGQARQVG